MGRNNLKLIPCLVEGESIHVYYRAAFLFKPKQTFTIVSINEVGGRLTIECRNQHSLAYLSYNPFKNQAYLVKKNTIVKVVDVKRA